MRMAHRPAPCLLDASGCETSAAEAETADTASILLLRSCSWGSWVPEGVKDSERRFYSFIFHKIF